jgi:hypothetical protein
MHVVLYMHSYSLDVYIKAFRQYLLDMCKMLYEVDNLNPHVASTVVDQ